MKLRKRKKYIECICAHNKSFEDYFPDYPVGTTGIIFQCAMRPDYTDEPSNFPDDYDPCEKCKNFTLSKGEKQFYKEFRKIIRLSKQYYNKKYKDNDEIFKQLDECLSPF